MRREAILRVLALCMAALCLPLAGVLAGLW